MVTITGDETTNPNVIDTLIIYLFTGFLLDPSIRDPESLTEEEAQQVNLSFPITDLYRVARFLQMDVLLSKIYDSLLDIYKPHTSNKYLVEFHFAGLLYVAQKYLDDDLMNATISLIESTAKGPTALLLGMELFTRDTWDRVIRGTSGSFMFACQVFIVYKIMFNVPVDDFNCMIKEFRDKWTLGAPSDSGDTSALGFTKILAGADTRLSLDGNFSCPSNIHTNDSQWTLMRYMP